MAGVGGWERSSTHLTETDSDTHACTEQDIMNDDKANKRHRAAPAEHTDSGATCTIPLGEHAAGVST
jgi:hypothetical protein